MNDHKYVVVKYEGKEIIFVFPKVIDHDRFVEGLQAIRMGSDRNWERWVLDKEVVSAGFVSNGTCHGRSETLNLDSRGAIDTALLLNTKY